MLSDEGWGVGASKCSGRPMFIFVVLKKIGFAS